MPLWLCDHADCGMPAARNIGDCILCNRHLCSHHVRPEVHKCPAWKDADVYDPAARMAEEHELLTLISKIDTAALEARATRLREGMPCSIPPLKYNREKRSSVMGGMNYHIEIHFDDSIAWIARIRRFNASSPPPALRDFIIRSEVATLMFLEKTTVPAPRVFDFAFEGPGNEVGVGFILQEKLPGKSLRWSLADDDQRRKVMSQVAEVFAELHKHPFSLLGSLDSPGKTQVGAFARESLADLDGDDLYTLGPFGTWKGYHESSLSLILKLILKKELYPQRPVDAYLIHLFLLDLVPSVLPSNNGGEGGGQKAFLKHADDKGDHIMVNDEYNVTGIIDWEWAHTAPAAVAFNSPIGFLPVGDFYDGINDIGEDEAEFASLLEQKGCTELAGYVKAGRLQHRFAFCCGYDLEDWDGFLGLFLGLRNAVGMDAEMEWNEWRQTAMKRYSEDAGLQMLLSREE